MGFLDELRAQAEAVQSRRREDEADFERHALATDEACKRAFHYWLDLARQLDVLRPPVPGRYAFDARHVLDGPAEGLRFEDFQVDARRMRLRGLELYDHAVIGCRVRFDCRNLEGLATIGIEFAAADVDTALLDELARWWLGRPNGFVAAGRVVAVAEP